MNAKKPSKVEAPTEVRIPPRYWQAAMECTSSDAARTILGGMWVYVLDDNVMLVATDSYRLSALLLTDEGDPAAVMQHAKPVAWVHRSTVDQAIKMHRALGFNAKAMQDNPDVWPTLTWADDGVCFTIGTNDIDQPYSGDASWGLGTVMPEPPKMANLMPQRNELRVGQSVAFDPDRLASFSKITKLLNPHGAQLALRGAPRGENRMKPNVFEARGESDVLAAVCYLLLMPVRSVLVGDTDGSMHAEYDALDTASTKMIQSLERQIRELETQLGRTADGVEFCENDPRAQGNAA